MENGNSGCVRLTGNGDQLVDHLLSLKDPWFTLESLRSRGKHLLRFTVEVPPELGLEIFEDVQKVIRFLPLAVSPQQKVIAVLDYVGSWLGKISRSHISF